MCFCCEICISQTDYISNYIGQEEGLSQTTNQFIFQDSRGFVWISTSNGGLNRYDGQRIKVYEHDSSDSTSLPDNLIQSSIIEDTLGNLWFSTQSALVCYVRKHDNFQSFHQSEEDSNYYLAFADRKGGLGVVIDGVKLYLFTPKKSNVTDDQWTLLETFPSSVHRVIPLFTLEGELSKLYAFNKDRIGLHIYSYEQSGQASYVLSCTGKKNEPKLRFSHILLQGDSVLWASTSSGLLRFEASGHSSVAYSLYKTFSGKGEGASLNKITACGVGKILASFTDGSWSVIDLENSSSEDHFLSLETWDNWKLPSDNVQGVLVDKNGVVWVGINGDGVYFAHPQKVKFKYEDVSSRWEKNELRKAVFALATDNTGNIWYSNRKDGVFKTSSSFYPLDHFYSDTTERSRLINNDIYDLLVDSKDRCWAFTYSSHGVGLFEPNSNAFRSVLTSNLFLHGLEIEDERLIFSPNGGLCVLDEENGDIKMVPLESIRESSLYTRLFQSIDGLLWGARDLTHIDIINPDKGFKIVDSLQIKADILSFYEDTLSNTIWVGTSIGLMCIDQHHMQYEIYDKSDGLPDNNVYGVLGSNDGSLWLSTNQGLVKYIPGAHHFHSFDVPDGLQASEFNREAYLQLGNGQFIFGGQNGLNIFYPDSIELIATRPKVQFTSLTINGGSVIVPPCEVSGATNISETLELKLGYNENTLDFEFAALEFSYPKDNTFKYKMEGLHNEWKNAGTIGAARFINLPAGNYYLSIVGISSDGIESVPKKIRITIAPFWTTWWFWLTIIVLALGVVVIYYRNKVNQILRLQKLRNQISDDLHDDIGASLSSINILISFIRKHTDKESKAFKYLGMIEEEAQSSTQSMDDIVWSINPNNDSMDNVISRMRYFAKKVTEPKRITCKFTAPQGKSHLRIAMDKRRHFYLIFKEAINNVVRHSYCRNVQITIGIRKQKIELSIADDGIGFDASTETPIGNGLRTMVDRAERIGGDLQINSSSREGTSIKLLFPYSRNL